MAEGEGNWITSAIRGLSGTPAYLLIFVLALTPAVTGSEPLVTVATLLIAAGVVAVVERSRRSQVPTTGPEQAKRLAGLNLPAREEAVRTVLGGIVDPDTDILFLYSSAPVEGFTRLDGRPTKYPFSTRDLQVTPILDAQGLAYIHSLLNLAGKGTERVNILTSREWLAEYWAKNLIIVGSPNANNEMAVAARRTGCPFRFNDDVSAIVEDDGGPGHRWPESEEQLDVDDYAILAKLKKHTPDGADLTYLVIAGIGPGGTLGACYYLWRNIHALAQRFGPQPFAGVLHVDRTVGFTSVTEVAPLRELSVAPV